VPPNTTTPTMRARLTQPAESDATEAITIDSVSAEFLRSQFPDEPNTLRAYSKGLSRFREFLADELGVDPSVTHPNALNDEHAYAFFTAYLPSTRKTHEGQAQLRTTMNWLSAVRRFFSYLIGHSLMTPGTLERLSARTRPHTRGYKPPPPDIRLSDIQRVVQASRDLPAGQSDFQELRRLRIKAITLTLFRTGARVSELCALRRRDIDLANGVATIWFGKGDKSRQVYFDTETAEALTTYWRTRGDGPRPGPLPAFSGRGGKPISVDAVEEHICELTRLAGVEASITPHTLRHGLGTLLCGGDPDVPAAPPLAVKEILGHASLATTQVYVHLANEDVQRAYRESLGAYRAPRGTSR
jgi:integrase/recombinase XerC